MALMLISLNLFPFYFKVKTVTVCVGFIYPKSVLIWIPQILGGEMGFKPMDFIRG